ncbi:unnamed protein product [Rotaria socialis]|uniref:Uncharacterized protein n=1 Tax=Rotaria socialis TaxID=392032 RepID=A0A818APP2_9BILA|nr:unnamed protein product [Rotaria socialis]
MILMKSILPQIQIPHHMKPECKMNPRCRKCLDSWELNHHCQKPILCAQCEDPHLSTSIECSVVYNYRITLKDQVKRAINDGLISLVEQLEVFKEKVSEKFNAITNDYQQQQTPTSPSLQPNSNRIQTKSTTFNNNANCDRMEQDSPITLISFSSSSLVDVKSEVIRKAIDWGFPFKVVQYVSSIMSECFSGYTLNSILSLWEPPTNHSQCQRNPLNRLNYNVQGWGTRALEAVELIFNSDSSIGIFTEEQANKPNVDENEQHDQKIVGDYNKIMNTVSQPLDIKVEKVASSEITKIIKKLKKKSSGYDQISNYIIKLLLSVYIDCLVKCFNVWLSEGRYPDFWKLAKIITLNKLNAGVPRPDQSRCWQHTRRIYVDKQNVIETYNRPMSRKSGEGLSQTEVVE